MTDSRTSGGVPDGLPRALVVHESMFGNTGQVAEAVADGLSERMSVELRDVAHAPVPGDVVDELDLLVVGGPTHAFSMSRPSTRADAVRQGAGGDPTSGLREWLDQLPPGSHTTPVATFDTRVAKVRHLPGSAARKASSVAHHHGFPSAGRESFYVAGTEGPLLPGELERARAWGRQLAEEAASSRVSR